MEPILIPSGREILCWLGAIIAVALGLGVAIGAWLF
jgi:hypothetical protein